MQELWNGSSYTLPNHCALAASTEHNSEHSVIGNHHIHSHLSELTRVAGFAWPSSNTPVAFVNVHGREQETATRSTAAGTSYMNTAEAQVVADMVQQLLRGGGLQMTDIGVITPYSGQVGCLPCW